MKCRNCSHRCNEQSVCQKCGWDADEIAGLCASCKYTQETTDRELRQKARADAAEAREATVIAAFDRVVGELPGPHEAWITATPDDIAVEAIRRIVREREDALELVDAVRARADAAEAALRERDAEIKRLTRDFAAFRETAAELDRDRLSKHEALAESRRLLEQAETELRCDGGGDMFGCSAAFRCAPCKVKTAIRAHLARGGR